MPLSKSSKAMVLFPGDTIEFSISQELPVPKGAATWCKAGGSTTVRPNETAEQAKKRLVMFVTDFLEDQVSELIVE